MVKYFSVDWLAQSHHSTAWTREGRMDPEPACRPHIPCMVQPQQPTFGQSYLQPKSKVMKPLEETSDHQDPILFSPPHPNCASPVLETSGYSSGYESEGSSSPGCLSVDELEKDAPLRRVRTKFTQEQIGKLEKIFGKHKYLDAGERMKTAQKLNLTETQVRTWFQNRRMKLKREVQDYPNPEIPPMFQTLLPVQFHSLAGQQHCYPAFYPLPVPQMHQIPPPLPLHLQPHFY